MGARPPRCRARPPEDQGGLEGLREDRRAARLPLSRQRRGRPRPRRTTISPASTTPSSTRSAPRPTGAWGSPARTCRAPGPPTEFVAWYNGHPDYQELSFDLSGERAVVVGAGNVAIDVVRMLALTAEEIPPTDTTDAAIEAILGSGLKEIVLLGPPRPGPGGIHDARAERARRAGRRRRDRRPRRPGARPCERGLARVGHERAPERRGASRVRGARAAAGKSQAIRLRFCVSPVAILGESVSRRSRSFATELVADERGRVRAEPTDEHETIPCGIVFRSVGYQRVELPGVPFDGGRAIPNEGGRVGRRQARPGVYCAGWIKRGPSGVIGTNKKDATETVDLPVEDARAGSCSRGDPRRDRRDRRRAARRARRRGRHLRGLGGDRPEERSARRAARASAREARDAGTSCALQH